MFKDRRKSVRYQFNRFARIQGETGGPSGDCLIVNISEDGTPRIMRCPTSSSS